MEAVELRRLQRGIIARHVRYSGGALRGILADVEAYLDQSPLLRVTKQRRTGDTYCMVETRCAVRAPVVTTQEIAEEVECIWVEKICLGAVEAHAVSSTPGQIRVDFVTTRQLYDDTSSYFTGCIIVDIDDHLGRPIACD